MKKLNASADQVENPQPMTLSIETLGNSTISSLGANKLNPTKASKTTSNLPALSISRLGLNYAIMVTFAVAFT